MARLPAPRGRSEGRRRRRAAVRHGGAYGPALETGRMTESPSDPRYRKQELVCLLLRLRSWLGPPRKCHAGPGVGVAAGGPSPAPLGGRRPSSPLCPAALGTSRRIPSHRQSGRRGRVPEERAPSLPRGGPHDGTLTDERSEGGRQQTRAREGGRGQKCWAGGLRRQEPGGDGGTRVAWGRAGAGRAAPAPAVLFPG